MIYPGTDLKFKVKALVPGFEMANHEFSIIVKNSFGQVKYIIQREDMLTDSKYNFYFMLRSVQQGTYYAVFMAEREDDNFEEGFQRIVDQQPLVSVGVCDCHQGGHVCKTDGVSVAYERVWTVNIDGMVYLCESDGTPILDSEGNRIYLQAQDGDESTHTVLDMTGAELKQLLEGRTPNGHVDTLPEALDVLHPMDDDTDVSLMTEQDADDMMSRILNGDD